MPRRIMIAIAAAAALMLGVNLAQAQETPGTPPSWDTLVRCAQMPSEDARLACYDAAMRAAGFAPKPEAVTAEKHKRFGLSIPQVGLLKRHGKEEGAQAAGATPSAPAKESEDEITVELAQVATLQPVGKLLLFTTDGQIWEQTDTDSVSPLPKSGDSIRIHKGRIGGYLCDVNNYKSVRCRRQR